MHLQPTEQSFFRASIDYTTTNKNLSGTKNTKSGINSIYLLTGGSSNITQLPYHRPMQNVLSKLRLAYQPIRTINL